VHTLRFALFLKFLFETLEAFGVFVHGTDVFLKDDLLSRCGADDFRKPLEVGGFQLARPV